ncbi:hypothetical protein BC834DRAFT_353039 [Gloeopeniophorella convolvens]|nr:hypothetical protein BC834DRAFT_353039 [Gloeopeniophorella convolvens]
MLSYIRTAVRHRVIARPPDPALRGTALLLGTLFHPQPPASKLRSTVSHRPKSESFHPRSTAASHAFHQDHHDSLSARARRTSSSHSSHRSHPDLDPATCHRSRTPQRGDLHHSLLLLPHLDAPDVRGGFSSSLVLSWPFRSTRDPLSITQLPCFVSDGLLPVCDRGKCYP